MKVFLSHFLTPGISGEQLKRCERIRRAVGHWVSEKGYCKPLASAGEVADDIGVPPEQLGAFIWKYAGRSVLSWRKQLRIEEAKVLLKEHPELPVSAVGRMVGIDDKTNFRRQFTEVTGLSPRAWCEKTRR